MLAQCCLPLSMSNEVKVWSCLASLRAAQSRQSMRQSPLLKLTGRRNDRAGHTARSKEGADAVGPTPSATPARPASRQMRLRRPFGRRYWLISNPMKEYCAAKRSKRNHDPSRGPGFACGDAGTRAAGRDDLLVPRGSADDGGWRTAVVAGVPGRGNMRCNNAARGHIADISRTPRGIFGNFAAEEQLRQNEQVHQDDPLRCQMGLDSSNRSCHGRTIFRMVNLIFGLPSTGSCRHQRQDPAYPQA